MPSLTPMATIQTTAKTDVKLSVSARRSLQLKLRQFARLKATAKAAEDEQRLLRADIETLLTKAGEFGALIDGVTFEGFALKHISPVSAKLDKKCLLVEGVTMGQIDNALAANTKPGTPYIRVSCPGEDE
jgi:hypothetical protein